jgi:hypothetical protein
MHDHGGQETDANMMQFDVQSAAAVLERTPSTLFALLGDLPDEWAWATEGPGTWSPYDVVGHLIHGERTDWIPRARIILDDGATHPFEPFDRTAMLRESAGKSLRQLLLEFADLRSENLEALDAFQLTDRELELQGRHPELGCVTLRQLLSSWVVHDLGHIAQIVRVMAKQYKQAIGPWRAYLTIVHDTVLKV